MVSNEVNVKGLELIVKHEGGLVNDSRDRGGMTYKGIARTFWPQWEGWKVIDHVLSMCNGDIKKANRELSRDTWLHGRVIALYKKEYWDKVRADDLGDDLGFQVTDCAVNCGIKTAARMLQLEVGAVDDGYIGKNTIAKVNAIKDKLSLILSYNNRRREYYKVLKQYPIYGKGWIARVDRNDDIAREALQ